MLEIQACCSVSIMEPGNEIQKKEEAYQRREGKTGRQMGGGKTKGDPWVGGIKRT